MKKLLLALSLIAFTLTANISWDKEKKIYCSTHFLWDDSLDDQKYHQLTLIFNNIIGESIMRYGSVFSHELMDFLRFLRSENSSEGFVLSHDIDDFLEQYYDVD